MKSADYWASARPSLWGSDTLTDNLVSSYSVFFHKFLKQLRIYLINLVNERKPRNLGHSIFLVGKMVPCGQNIMNQKLKIAIRSNVRNWCTWCRNKKVPNNWHERKLAPSNSAYIHSKRQTEGLSCIFCFCGVRMLSRIEKVLLYDNPVLPSGPFE